MAEVLASLKKIGGSEQYTETVLWTNPSPNSEFAPQIVTLSDSISNYKYIKFTYKHDSNNSTSDVSAIYIESNDLVMLTESAQTLAVAICARNSSNAPYNRQITYENATSIKIHRAQVYNGTTINNSLAIPLEILGVNELAHGKIYENYATGYLTQAQPSVDLGFVPKYVFCANATSNNANAVIYDANVSTTQYRFIAGGIDEMRNIGAIGTSNQFNMSGTTIGTNPNSSWSSMTGNHRQYVAIGYDNQ